jgi:hypothetical protein
MSEFPNCLDAITVRVTDGPNGSFDAKKVREWPTAGDQ